MREEIIEKMRAENKTFYEIGQVLGVSRQRAEQLAKKTKARKGATDIERIVYKGIYEMFKADKKLTFRQLERIMLKAEPTTNQFERIKNFLFGAKSRIEIECVINICNHLNKPVQEVFARRK